MTLQEQLKATPVDGTVDEKMLAYNRANRQVAILCNHQRAPPKAHEQQVEKMDAELDELRDEIKTLKKYLKQIKSEVRAFACCLTLLTPHRAPGLLRARAHRVLTVRQRQED